MSTLAWPNGQPQGQVQMPGWGQPPGQQQTPTIPVAPTVQPQAGRTIQYGWDQLPPSPQQMQAQPQMQVPLGYGPQFPQQTPGLAPVGYATPQGGAVGSVPQYGYGQTPQQQPGWGVQQQVQQPAAPGWGQQPAAPQLSMRLDGPQVPDFLRGRTIAEALSITSALATDWAQRQGQSQYPVRPQTPAAQSLGQLPQSGQSGQPGQPGTQQSPARRPSLWENPEEVIGQIVEQRLAPALQPMQQFTQQASIQQAAQIASGSVPDFQIVAGETMQLLQGSPPQLLADPQTWIHAADLARGRMQREGRYAQPQQQPQAQVPGASGRPATSPPGMLPSQPATIPTYGFFTESPTVPSTSQFGAPQQPSPEDELYAKKFSMPISDYLAWKYGAQAQSNGSGQVQQPAQFTQPFQFAVQPQPAQQWGWGGGR